jgi:hypothetical protein
LRTERERLFLSRRRVTSCTRLENTLLLRLGSSLNLSHRPNWKVIYKEPRGQGVKETRSQGGQPIPTIAAREKKIEKTSSSLVDVRQNTGGVEGLAVRGIGAVTKRTRCREEESREEEAMHGFSRILQGGIRGVGKRRRW